MGYNCAAPRKQPQLGLLLIDFQVEISPGRGARAGRMGLTRNQVIPRGIRGFESHPLRHFSIAYVETSFGIWVRSSLFSAFCSAFGCCRSVLTIGPRRRADFQASISHWSQPTRWGESCSGHAVISGINARMVQIFERTVRYCCQVILRINCSRNDQCHTIFPSPGNRLGQLN